MPPTHHRYAVYFAPNPGSLGWLAGSHWLGRCAALLQPLQQLVIDGVAAEDLHRLTAAPRRYGWHATLKAPFALAPGTDWITLHQAVQSVARGLQPFVLPPLQVQRIDDFLALVPPALHPANAQIQETAATCVTALQPLAAPLSDADLARRQRFAVRAQDLDPRAGQRAPGRAGLSRPQAQERPAGGGGGCGARGKVSLARGRATCRSSEQGEPVE